MLGPFKVAKAETSITIDDVTHVIDSCHVKETRFSPQSSTSVWLGRESRCHGLRSDCLMVLDGFGMF